MAHHADMIYLKAVADPGICLSLDTDIRYPNFGPSPGLFTLDTTKTTLERRHRNDVSRILGGASRVRKP